MDEVRRILGDVFDHEEREFHQELLEELRRIAHYLGRPYHAYNSTITLGDDMQATQNFLDANGLATSAPAGLVEAWASDNEAVATIDAASGAVTEVSEGTANISVANSGATLPDGVTPFPDPTPFALTVTVGGAVSSTISVA